ncbi:hypothetical protein CEXT_12091 [Caerostris extrusa]|uniref:Uncharacterized protein n=1 Tax=Caerostris extrusa TaxID=172846 RepID=A0AAV4Y6V4_CAEEX|nr:hypothetical protein CEXT_12091 [Caerostris extrusa]
MNLEKRNPFKAIGESVSLFRRRKDKIKCGRKLEDELEKSNPLKAMGENGERTKLNAEESSKMSLEKSNPLKAMGESVSLFRRRKDKIKRGRKLQDELGEKQPAQSNGRKCELI